MSSIIYGIGCDVVKMNRIAKVYQRHGQRFLRRAYHPTEIKTFDEISTSHTSKQVEFLASRWAVKEAATKAFSTHRISFSDMYVTKSSTPSSQIGNLGNVMENTSTKASMDISGNCYCGNITITGKIDPSKTTACHCKDCQIFSGAPVRVSVKAKNDETIINGEPRHFIKEAASGNKRIQGFCGDCGTNLYSTDINQQLYNIRVGCLDNSETFSPVNHIFEESSVNWLNYNETDKESKQKFTCLEDLEGLVPFRSHAQRPVLQFNPTVQLLIQQLGIINTHVSLSHDEEYAFATVVLENKKT